MGFPESGAEELRSQTIGTRNPKKSNLLCYEEYVRKTKDDPNEESSAFSNLKNGSLIKNLDAPDDVPQKPTLLRNDSD